MSDTYESQAYRIIKHHREQFGVVSIHQIVAKLLEECGEVSGAVTRWTEARTDDNWAARALDEIGDVTIVLEALVHYLDPDVTLDTVRQRAARTFLSRQWDIKKGQT